MKKLRNAQISSFNCLVREVDGMGIIWGDDVVVYGAWTTANTFPGGNGHGRGRESKQKSKKSASKEDAPRGFPPFGVFFASTSTV